MQEKNTAHRVFYHNRSMAIWLGKTEASILFWCRQGRNAREGVVPHLAFTPGPVALRMHLEATVGFTMTEEGVVKLPEESKEGQAT